MENQTRPGQKTPIKTAVITGAGGFVGRALVHRLSQSGVLVRALVHHEPSSAIFPAGVKTFVGDVRDVELMKRCTEGAEAVFHFAAKVPKDGSPQDEADVSDVSVNGTRNVLDAALKARAESFMFLSSLSIHGRPASGVCDESTPIAPLSAYGRAKAAAEQMVLEAGRHASIRVTCLRPPMVYGLGCAGSLPRMIKRVAQGRIVPMPRSSGRRIVLHVQNLVDACILAAKDRRATGQCYVVADPRAYSVRDMFELICNSTDRYYPSWEVPMWLLKAGARAGDAARKLSGRRVLLDSERLQDLVGSSEFSTEKICRELGYQPRFSLEEELPRIVRDVLGDLSRSAA